LDLDWGEFEGFWGLRDGSCSVLRKKKEKERLFGVLKMGFGRFGEKITGPGILESERIVLFCLDRK